MAQCFCRTGVSASERSVGQWLITPMLRAVIKKKGIWTVSTPIAAAGSLLTTLLLTMPTTTHDKSNCRFARPAIDPLVEVNDRMVWLNVCVRWDVRPVSSVPDSRSDAIPSLKQKKNYRRSRITTYRLKSGITTITTGRWQRRSPITWDDGIRSISCTA